MTMTAVLDPEGRLVEDDKASRRQLSASAAPFVPGGVKGGGGGGSGGGVPQQWEQTFQSFSNIIIHKNKESETRLQQMEAEMRYLTESRRSDSSALRYDLDVLMNKVDQLRSKVTTISNHVRSDKTQTASTTAPSSTPPISAISAQTTPNTTTVSGLSSLSSADKDPWGYSDRAIDQVEQPVADFDASELIISLVSTQHEGSPESEEDTAPHTDLSALFNSVSELNL